MSSEKHFFIDRRFVLFFLATAFVVTMTVFSFFGNPILGAIFAFVSVVSVVATALTPAFFMIDRRGVSIRYIIGVRQEIRWEKVTRVTLEYDDASSHGRLHLPYLLDSYAFHGESEGKTLFFMSAKVPRSGRVRRTVERYMSELDPTFEIVDERKPMKEKSEEK